MTQTLAATLIAPSRPDLTLAYRVVNLNLSAYSGYLTTGVTQSASGSGLYRVSGGIVAPDQGGFIEWWFLVSSSPTELIAIAPIPPAPALASDTRFTFLDRAISSREPRYGWPA